MQCHISSRVSGLLSGTGLTLVIGLGNYQRFLRSGAPVFDILTRYGFRVLSVWMQFLAFLPSPWSASLIRFKKMSPATRSGIGRDSESALIHSYCFSSLTFTASWSGRTLSD